MPMSGISQPQLLTIDETLRLRRYDGAYQQALPWYQDAETVWLVDGVRTPYDLPRLQRMYEYLDARGELYWIELADSQGIFRPVGDVTFWPQDLPIVIGEPVVRSKGLGRKVVAALIARGKALGFAELRVGEIYDWNPASRRMFESLGFAAVQRTQNGHSYRLVLQKER